MENLPDVSKLFEVATQYATSPEATGLFYLIGIYAFAKWGFNKTIGRLGWGLKALFPKSLGKYSLNATSLGLMSGGAFLGGQGVNNTDYSFGLLGAALAFYGFIMIFGVNGKKENLA